MKNAWINLTDSIVTSKEIGTKFGSTSNQLPKAIKSWTMLYKAALRSFNGLVFSGINSR
jgi:hypothetical protein